MSSTAVVVSWPPCCSKEGGSRNAPNFGDLPSQRHGSAEVHESELRRTGQTGFGRPGRANPTGSHPETTQPELHVPTWIASHPADTGYLVDRSTFDEGKHSMKLQRPSRVPVAAPISSPAHVTASFTSSSTEALRGIKFSYSMQDTTPSSEYFHDSGFLPDLFWYQVLLFHFFWGLSTVSEGLFLWFLFIPGSLPDASPITAGNSAGRPQPRTNLHNSVSYFDKTPVSAPRNFLQKETMQRDLTSIWSAHTSDVGYLVDQNDAYFYFAKNFLCMFFSEAPSFGKCGLWANRKQDQACSNIGLAWPV